MIERLPDLPDSWARPQVNWRNRLIVASIVLAPLLYVGIAVWKGQSRTIHVVNGTSSAYDVEVAGQPMTLAPMRQTPVQVAEGDVLLRVKGGDVPIADQTIRIETSFWTRPAVARTFVVNPDGAAILLWEEVEYAANPTNAKNQYAIHAANVLHEFSNIDFEFEPLPDSVNLGKSRSTIKRRVSLEALDAEHAIELLATQLGDETAAEYAMAAGRFDSRNEYLWNAVSGVEHAKLASFLKPGIDRRPLLVYWHRAYQDMIERHEPGFDLTSMYRQLLAEDPDDPARIYLAARLDDENPQRQEEAFTKASEMGLGLAPPFHWLCYSQFGTVRFEEALASARKLAACNPQDAHYRFHVLEALLALGRVDEALQFNAQAMTLTPSNGYLVADQIVLHYMKGDTDAGDAVANAFVGRKTRELGAETAQAWARIFEAVRRYQQGDAKGFGEVVLGFNAETWRFGGLVSSGRLNDALQALADSGDQGSGHLVLAVAALAAEDRALADQCLEKAAAALRQDGGFTSKTIADWLLSQSAPDAMAVCDVRTRTPVKLPLLLVMGLKHPSVRQPCFELASKLNCWPQFPHLIYEDVLDRYGSADGR